MNTINKIPLTLYIHMPWCIRKCPYCDFNSYTITSNSNTQNYINALLQDLQGDLANIQNRELISIFIGGGTPSLFSPTEIAQLLHKIQQQIKWKKNLEITMEVNPGTFNQQQLLEFRATGINRLSVGIQSFQDTKLKSLGRIHNAKQAKQAIEIIHKVNFNNFNLDLMHGLPQQTVAEALHDLQTAIKLSVPHISWYQLTIEPNTYFADHCPQLPSEKILEKIQQEGNKLLTAAHYQHYEISNYCQSQYRCQHNINYWEFGDYLGIGAGAHSKITNLQTGIIKRYHKHTNPQEYLNSQKSFIAHTEIIPQKDLPLEFMLNALRLNEGVPIRLFTERTGIKLAMIMPSLLILQKQGLITLNNSVLATTQLGKKFLNKCLEIFVAT